MAGATRYDGSILADLSESLSVKLRTPLPSLCPGPKKKKKKPPYTQRHSHLRAIRHSDYPSVLSASRLMYSNKIRSFTRVVGEAWRGLRTGGRMLDT